MSWKTDKIATRHPPFQVGFSRLPDETVWLYAELAAARNSAAAGWTVATVGWLLAALLGIGLVVG